MYELIRLSEHDYYIDCPAKMGLIDLGSKEAAAIDSGSDKDAGKKLLKQTDSLGLKLTAVYNTHSHADHIGGNKLVQERSGCRIYAAGMEAVYTARPELESMTLWGGNPFKELKNKFLMAEKSSVLPLTAEVLPEGMNFIELPGHSFDMVGFKTADGNIYIGDSVSSAETLEKYGIGYLWDPEASLATLDKLETLEARYFVPAHAAVTEDIRPLAALNRKAILDTAALIRESCSAPQSFESLLEMIFRHYSLVMTAQQYALIGSTLRSYLSWLYGKGEICCYFEGARMLWQRS